MSQGITFQIKRLDSKSNLDNQKRVKNSVTQDAAVSSITSWSKSQVASRAELKEKQLVIPLQPDSYGLPQVGGRGSEDKALEEEAIRAILSETAGQSEQLDSVTVPLQPASSRASEESSREEYSQIPVSSFGKAALLGMGWKEGDSVGKSNKGIPEPIELIPHSAGLGLGAVARKDKTKKSSKKESGPVVGTDGRVKHHRGLDEEVQLATDAGKLKPGSYVRISEGAHEGLLGKVRELDSDGKHVLVSLSLGESLVSLSMSGAVLLDPLTMRPVVDRHSQKSVQGRKLNKTYGLILRGKHGSGGNDDDCTNSDTNTKTPEGEKLGIASSNTNSTQIKVKPKIRNSHTLKSKSTPKLSKSSWIRSNLKVRLISKKYKKGRYYNSKVSIVDVISPGVCLCQSDQGQLLEEVSEEMLETLIPKDLTQPVMVVSGQYRGQLGFIQQKYPNKCVATLLMEDLDNCLDFSYDDICQVDEMN